ncbi:MAG: hypothetical protein J6I49_00765 [Bacteroidales bacterium]|nr:hypothetical protein [Bacteroidales bacterium]
MSTAKRRKNNLIVSYKNLSDDLKARFKEAYPDGYTDHLQRFVKPNGETIFVVPFETEETAYMVKFEVKIDTLGEDLDKALFDDDEETKQEEFAPLSEALEKEEADPAHKQKELVHGAAYEDVIADEEERKKKISLGINKEEIKAAFGDDDAEELDSYERIGDDEESNDDDFEPSDEDLRGIEEEYLDAEIPPLDATIPESEMAQPKPKSTRKKKSKQ